MKIAKFFHSNKGFFLLSLAAAVFGIIISIFFSGCSRDEQDNRVIVSKRVKIDVKDIVNIPVEVGPAKELKAGEVFDEKKSVKARKSHKTASIKKTGTVAKAVTKASAGGAKGVQKRLPLKTMQRSWVINVSSLTKISDAGSLKKRLSSAGFNAYTTEFTKGGILYYRVRVGFYSTSEKARKEGKAITSKFRGVDSTWVSKPGMDEILKHNK